MSERFTGSEHEQKAGFGFLISVALVSFSLLAYEIVLSRLLSVLLSYHFVFLILSLALLGLGLGGLLLHLLASPELLLSKGFGLLVHLGALLSVAIPASGFSMAWLAGIEGMGGDVLWYAPPIMIPFLLGGAFLALVYRLLPGSSGRTYGADLMGAAVGALGAILLLEMLGALGAPLALGIMASGGVLILGFSLPRETRSSHVPGWGGISLIVVMLIGFVHWAGLIPLEISPKLNPGKEIHQALTQFKGRIIQSRWSSFGRTDLVAYDQNPQQMDLYLDGTAGSPMYRFHGRLEEPPSWLLELQDEFPAALALSRLAEKEKDNALIIGPGGGRDLILALLAGFKEIEAVEVNPDLVHMVRETAWFNGGIYKDFPGVKVVVDEGRSYLKRQHRLYDLIFLSLPVTNTSRSIEGYSLTENYLFTRESMADYWDHLTDEGRLVVVAHNDAELLRLVTTAVSALDKKGLGVQAVMTRIWVLSSGDYLVLVLKKNPFEPSYSLWAYESSLQKGYELSESFLPFISPAMGLNPALAALASGRLSPQRLVEEVSRKGYDIRPVSDESPFFYKLESGAPANVLAVLHISLWLLLAVGIFLVLRGKKLLLPHVQENTRGVLKKPKALGSALFFCALGAGFILVEIYAVQRLCLVIGQPVWTMGAVIFSILVSGGAGSFWASRWAARLLYKRISLICLLLSLGLLAYGASFHFILEATRTWPQWARLVAAAGSLVPLGFLMGIPFPLGIRALGLQAQSPFIPWMWALNGIASVVGSSLGILLALELGFTWALAAACLCYLLGFLARIID